MKTDKDIENMLMDGKKLSLSVNEKSSIKTALLERVAATQQLETRAIPSPWASWLFSGSVSFASLLVMFMGTAYASQNSLPGEPLYAIKVHVVEEMIALTKITPEKQVAYDIELMENRLEEIKEIVSQTAVMTVEDLVLLSDQIDEHVTDVTTELEGAYSNHITYEEKMEVLTKLSGVTKAQIEIAKETTELAETVESINETQEFTTDAITNTIKDFVADESVEVVNEYLSSQITDLGEYMNASTTDMLARDTAERHLHDVDEALMDGNTTEAIISIVEAHEDVTVDEYTEESEDNIDG